MLLDVRGLSLHTPEGRPLVSDLRMQLDREKVALIGRNGVGKSTLLRALAEGHPQVRRGALAYVPQHLTGSGSPGQLRRRALEDAFAEGAPLLLLDEPSEDLDGEGRVWLSTALRAWSGGLVVVSHDPGVLDAFGAFFVMDDGGCSLETGSWQVVQQTLVEKAAVRQHAYVRRLEALERSERKHHRVQRRRDRKRNVGRLHELDRNQSKSRLNQRKAMAQVSQAKVNARQQARRDEARTLAAAARKALARPLPLDVAVPTPPPSSGPVVVATGVSFAGRTLDLALDRQRIGVVGPNGCGKSTLLDRLTGHRTGGGVVRFDPARMGVICQSAANWIRDESLIDLLGGPQRAVPVLVAHHFPLGLASRPLAELSLGERVRAALIACFDREGLELLVLDEPTGGLDLVGQHALAAALRSWQGGLLVSSHDRRFLDAVGVEEWIRTGTPATG